MACLLSQNTEKRFRRVRITDGSMIKCDKKMSWKYDLFSENTLILMLHDDNNDTVDRSNRDTNYTK